MTPETIGRTRTLADPTAWTKLRGCRVETALPGDVLCREGDPAANFWLVVDGALEMTQRGPRGRVTRAIRGPGEAVEETDALLDEPYETTVRVIEPALLVRVVSAAVAEALRSAPDLGVELLRTLCVRQTRANERLRRAQAAAPAPSGAGSPAPGAGLSAAAVAQGRSAPSAPTPPPRLPPAELARLQQGCTFEVPRGWKLFSEGDPSTHFYLVVEGGIRIHIPAPPGSANGGPPGRLTLATLGPGEFFGEIAALTGVPRTAAATAAVHSLVLGFDKESANDLMRLAPNTALRILRTLCRRLEETERKLVEAEVPRHYFAAGGLLRLLDEPGARLPEEDLPGGRVAAYFGELPAESARPWPAAAYDSSRLWTVPVDCPLCDTTFAALNVRPGVVVLDSFESDLYWSVREQSSHPVHHAVWVCPSCGYAAFPGDWTLSRSQEGAVRRALEGLPRVVAPLITAAAEPNETAGDGAGEESSAAAQADPVAAALVGLTGERDPAQAAAALELALRCYERRPGTGIPQAVLHHYLAWLARDRLDEEAERHELAAALEAYRQAQADGLYRTPRAKMVGHYLRGELALRLERAQDALDPLHEVIRAAGLANALGWAKLAQDRRDHAREQAQAFPAGRRAAR